MTDSDPTARKRWLAIVATRIAGAAGAVFGLFLAAKVTVLWIQILGGAILLSALYMMAVVPRSLAHKWRMPDA